MPKATLQRYLAKYKANAQADVEITYDKSYLKNRVLTDIMGTDLENYLLQASRQLNGLTKAHLRNLAYQFTKQNNCRYPKSRDETTKAGNDWVDSFLHRHSRLSVRKPQATSLSRATSFNRHNLNCCYDNVETVMKRYKFAPNSI